MTRASRLALILLATLLLVNPVSKLLTYGDPVVGDRWIYLVENYSTGLSWRENRTITQVTASNFTIKIERTGSEKQEFLCYTMDWTLIKRTVVEPETMVVYTYSPGFKLYDFPMEIGKTWISEYEEEFHSTIIGNPLANRTGFAHRSFIVSVVRRESVRLRNMSYEIYVVDYNYTVLGTNVRWYEYSFNPDLNANVREVTFTPRGAVFEERELVEWEISAPPEREHVSKPYIGETLVTVVVIASIILLPTLIISLARARRCRRLP